MNRLYTSHGQDMLPHSLLLLLLPPASAAAAAAAATAAAGGGVRAVHITLAVIYQ